MIQLDKQAMSFSWKDIPKVLLVIGAITIIAFLFPSHSDKDFQYGVNETWKYEDLTAASAFSYTPDSSAVFDSLVQPRYYFEAGDVIISEGQLIDEVHYEILKNYLRNEEGVRSFFQSTGLIYFIGYILLTTLILGSLILFSFKYFPVVTKSINGIGFLILWPVIFSVLVYLVTKNEFLSPYLIPFCITPIVVYNFYGGRLALFIHIVVVLIASFLSGLGYEFTFLQILAGIVTVLTITETRYWDRFFLSIFVIMFTYMIGYLGLALINSGTLDSYEVRTFGWLGVNALLLLLSYPFIPMVEKLFGYTSSITIAELGDMNKPLLRQLSLKVPGTLQHSLQVANLSEAAAKAIGANSLLVKVGALYHDVGKMNNPYFFIENQNEEAAHSTLNNFESAKVIIAHVTEGESMAKKARLPKAIIDFITTHHGTTRVEYFYRKQLKDEPEREFDESLFRYPGPKPKTKEQTILMLADSIEAAIKSLKQPSPADIDAFIDEIVEYKIEEGQLNESKLSFRELQICIETFRSLLRSIYHVRIEYPKSGQNA